MAGSTLDPDLMPEPDRSLGSGHDSKSLGPSDVTDTGSDVQPGIKAVEEDDIGLDKGTTEDPDTRLIDVEGDSDATGTGERATAVRESVETAADINIDRIDEVNDDMPGGLDDMPRPGGRNGEQRQQGRP
ncbi:hypothetical protein [Noviherbaspirillum aridicola]|uniref:Uncharacterized protein n=1 Tax=Noviherbaspirillum aridicola TaxID=2849687 RepID=A0ABQ4Q3F1_9BURK|nr:hypothetical protein [Noviherbaspirillum aridicola]GIZ51721.1 hypothetical protein NCCP691_17350 [Noviherbaspirillum aridicola]